MKYKINPFLYSLIKQNLIIFIIFLFFIFLNIFLITVNNNKLSDIKNKNLTLEQEINNYQNKINIINNLSSNSEKLNKYVNLLNNLIPDKEDYFSIIYALENISIKTGFKISSYTVNISLSSPEKLKIIITGVGNSNDFLNFLNNYNFSGGRLITSDKIELSNEASELYKINLTFYSKKVILSEDFKSNYIKDELFKKLDNIEKKVSINFELNDQKNINYPRKQNKNLF